MDFKDIYEKCLKNAESLQIDSNNNSSKPIMVTGIISPETKFIIQPNFYVNFSIDKKGMYKVIDMFERVWKSKSNVEKNNLVVILSEIYNITNDYLGGRTIQKLRFNEYSKANNYHLTLSQIEDKKIGACTERTAIAHQLLVILKEAKIIDYESFFTNSRMTQNTSEPHSFIILVNKKFPSKKFIYDIENPIEYKINNNTNYSFGVGLYHITEEEYQAFQSGKIILPKSIFEDAGMTIKGEKIFYGNGSRELEIDR